MANEDARIRNLRAENYILNQRIATEWIYATDEWKKEARQFCVSGLAEIDMLTEIQQQLGEALKQGIGFSQFKKEIVPYLQQKGWLGADEKAIGSRVQKIFDTNMASANAESLWNSIQETKDKFPYLQYIGSISGEKREEHKPFYGLVAHADDPIWQRIFPPNGYGCKCSVKQLTKGQAERIIKQQEENGGRIVASEEAINKAVDSSFQHSPQALGGLPAYIEQKHNLEVVNKLLEGVLANPKGLATGEEWTIFREGADFVEKNATVFLSEDFKKNPDVALMRIVDKTSPKRGTEGIFFYTQGSKGVVKDFRRATKILPSSLVETSNAKGNVFLVEAGKARKEGENFHIVFTSQASIDFFKNTAEYQKIRETKIIDGKRNILLKDALSVNDSIIVIDETKSNVLVDCIHEFTHRIQFSSPEIQDFYLNFFLRRTKNDKETPLNTWQGYEWIKDNSITVKKDAFYDAYFGRIYANNGIPFVGLEVMTRSFERLFTPKHSRDFLDQDFELFAFTLGILLRYWR